MCPKCGSIEVTRISVGTAKGIICYDCKDRQAALDNEAAVAVATGEWVECQLCFETFSPYQTRCPYCRDHWDNMVAMAIKFDNGDFTPDSVPIQVTERMIAYKTAIASGFYNEGLAKDQMSSYS